MTYDEALARIDGLQGRPWRSGLDRMRAFVDRAGLDRGLRDRGYIHIAGTNGKGTTTAYCEAVLRAQGWRTGAFYSPYVVDYRERIQADGRLIDQDDLIRLAERLIPIADSLSETPFGGATKFELETAMGLAYWEHRRSDWVALEVGLGGRLDATNVVTPRVAVIVSIGLDHTSILGDRLEEIAAEKAGIAKPGVPLIVGEMATVARETIERIAQEVGSPLLRYGQEIRVSSDGTTFHVDTPFAAFEGLRPAPMGPHSVHNAALAVVACAVAGAIPNPSALGDGLADARLPGRFERRSFMGREVLLDGAHNAAAARSLIPHLGSRIVLVTNMLAGHEVEPFYEAFLGPAIRAEVAPIDVPRALDVGEGSRRIAALGIPARPHGSVEQALLAALDPDPTTQILVTGSNYLVGAASRLLG